MAHATALRGESVAVHVDGEVVKVIAAASMGPGADVHIASGASGRFQPVAGASGTANTSVGQNVSGAAAAGEVFSLYVSPRQLGGLA